MQTTPNVEIDRKALFVPAIAPLYGALAPLGSVLIRVALGVILMPHGFAKLFLNDAVPTSRHFLHWGWAYPLAWAYFIGALEFFGGHACARSVHARRRRRHRHRNVGNLFRGVVSTLGLGAARHGIHCIHGSRSAWYFPRRRRPLFARRDNRARILIIGGVMVCARIISTD